MDKNNEFIRVDEQIITSALETVIFKRDKIILDIKDECLQTIERSKNLAPCYPDYSYNQGHIEGAALTARKILSILCN